MTNYEGFYDASLYTPRYPAWEMMEKETVKAFAITTPPYLINIKLPEILLQFAAR